MEVSTEKSKIMTSSTNYICADISMSGQKLEKAKTSSALCKDDISAEIRIRIAPAMAAMVRLNRIWKCTTISLARKFKL